MSMHSSKTTTAIAATGLLVGLVFGLALEKAQILRPSTIRDQMALKSFIMMKMFLTAVATSMLVHALLERTAVIKRSSSATLLRSKSENSLLKGNEGSLLGGMILGIGMTISGTCPGTVVPQLFTGAQMVAPVVLGALFGAFLIARTHFHLHARSGFLATRPSFFYDQSLNVSYTTLAVAFASFLYAVVFLVDWIFPWREEVHAAHPTARLPMDGRPTLFDQVWNPVLSGVIVGLLQLPGYLFANTPLGASSCFVSFSGLISSKVFSLDLPYFKGYMSSTATFQQALVAGAGLGAYLSSTLSGNMPGIQTTFGALTPNPVTQFLGGVLLIVGARTAGGCPSGHGITGLSKLAHSSAITVVGMFAGGMSCALVLHLLA